MPRYYCDYCDTYLTHDSPSVRKQHNAGYKHKANVRTYYQQFEEQQTQSLIDQKIKEHLGQTAVYQQVGAAYNQHLASRPRLPILPPPVLPIPGAVPSPLVPGVRPPLLPRPGPPGYGAPPGMAPTMGQPPAAAPFPMQVNSLPRPPTLFPPTVPGGVPATASNSAPAAVAPAYQANPTAGSTGSTASASDAYAHAPVPEANH